MAKILSVKVWGFQSHTDTKYDLAEGLNVFTGATDSGKTSGTIRALRWLAKGEPSGEAFLHTVHNPDGSIKHQAEEAGVELQLDNGVTIRKTRRSGKTKYWVLPLYEDPFEKAEVPEAVKGALGIKTTSFGDFEVDLHFAYQLAAPFLISEPGSAGAKVLGRIAGTEAVDQAIKSVAKDTYAARNEKASADKEYERKVAQLLDYLDLDDLQKQLDACDWLLEEIDAAVAKKANLELLTASHSRAAQAIEQAAATLDRLATIPALEDDLEQIEKAQKRYDALLDLYEKLGKATATVETLTEQLKQYAGIEAAEYRLTEAEEAAGRVESLVRLSKEYHSASESVKASQAVIDATKDLDVAAALLADVEATRKRREELLDLELRYNARKHDADRYQALLDSLEGVTEADALITVAEARVGRLVTLRESYRVWEVKEATRARAEADYDRATKELRAAERELAEAWAAVGGICPLCQQEVAHNH
jgi:exonuclease SbcC